MTTAEYLAQLTALQAVIEGMVKLARSPAAPPVDEVPSTAIELLEGAAAHVAAAIEEVDEDPDTAVIEDFDAQDFVDMPRGRPIE
jgi:hypothetical protein